MDARLAEKKGLKPLGVLPRLRGRRLRAGRDGHRPGVRDAEAAGARRPEGRGHRPVGTERGLRRAGDLLPRSARHSRRSSERRWRRDRRRPSVRCQRPAPDRSRADRGQAPRRRSGRWSRCASAAAWVQPACSRSSDLERGGRQSTQHRSDAIQDSFPAGPRIPAVRVARRRRADRARALRRALARHLRRGARHRREDRDRPVRADQPAARHRGAALRRRAGAHAGGAEDRAARVLRCGD